MSNKNSIGQLNYRSSADRLEFDSYFTPPYATELLVNTVEFEGVVWEPASGDGHISKILEKKGMEVVSSDLRPDCYGTSGFDFFSSTQVVDNIITNPPYKGSEKWVEHGLKLTTKKLAMLFRLSFLESAKRNPMFNNTPLEHVWVLSKRLPHWDGKTFKGSATFAHAWFVWDHSYEGETKIGWLI